MFLAAPSSQGLIVASRDSSSIRKCIADKAIIANPRHKGWTWNHHTEWHILSGEAVKALILRRGFAWLDTSTLDSLADAASFILITENVRD